MSRLRSLGIEVILPILVFIGVYIAGSVAFGALLMPLIGHNRMLLAAWATFAGAAVANLVCVALFDRFRLRLGIIEPLRALLGGLLKGTLVAVGLLMAANSLILATTEFRHVAGNGLDWFEVLALFVPAAIHEELAFRGYLLQKPAKLHLIASVGMTSVLFALIHGGNPSVGKLALLNIFLAGILLALAWVWQRNLWIPIGIHISWNVFSGPVLGHEVSGIVLPMTMMKTVDPGPAILTGGAFGIEASIFLTLAELGAIVFIGWRIRVRGPLPTADSVTTEAMVVGVPEDVPAAFPFDVTAPPPSKETES